MTHGSFLLVVADMEEDLLFRILFVSVYVVFAGARFYYRGKNVGRESKKDYGKVNKSTLFLSAAILGYLGLVVVYVLLPDLIAWAYLSLPTLIRWLGFGLALIGIGLTLLTHRTLGMQYSARLEIQKEHNIITEGIYNHVRHPMYISLNTFSFAMSLMSSNLLLIIFSLLVMLPFPWIARQEESMLIDQFGDEYRNYMGRTGRFFPRIRGPKEDTPSA